jgi:hypothetical protein
MSKDRRRRITINSRVVHHHGNHLRAYLGCVEADEDIAPGFDQDLRVFVHVHNPYHFGELDKIPLVACCLVLNKKNFSVTIVPEIFMKVARESVLLWCRSQDPLEGSPKSMSSPQFALRQKLFRPASSAPKPPDSNTRVRSQSTEGLLYPI